MLAGHISLTILLMVGSSTVQAPGPQEGSHSVFLPTSAALDVAQKVARDLGYDTSDRKAYFFDLMTANGGNAVLSGYVTLGFYANSNLLNQISINESTGQVVDSLRCIVFEYADLRSFQEELRRETGAAPIPAAELASSLGCEALQHRNKRIPLRRSRP